MGFLKTFKGRLAIISELFSSLKARKKFWLVPILVLLLLVIILILLGESAAPIIFIYPLF